MNIYTEQRIVALLLTTIFAIVFSLVFPLVYNHSEQFTNNHFKTILDQDSKHQIRGSVLERVCIQNSECGIVQNCIKRSGSISLTDQLGTPYRSNLIESASIKRLEQCQSNPETPMSSTGLINNIDYSHSNFGWIAECHNFICRLK